MGTLSDHKPEQKMILLSAGGTGGHVFPARALAEELLSKNYRVAVATDTRGLKYFEGLDQSVERHVIASGAYTSGLKGKISGILALARGYVQSHGLISRLKPAVVVGFGGYPSAPPVFAAQHRGIPTILHEQNAILGMANALLASKAKKTCAFCQPHNRFETGMVFKMRDHGKPCAKRYRGSWRYRISKPRNRNILFDGCWRIARRKMFRRDCPEGYSGTPIRIASSFVCVPSNQGR